MFFTRQKFFLFTFCLSFTSAAYSQSRELPEDFEQIIPRGRIAAVTNPKFVPAAEAKIAAESWIFGIVTDGKARAYSLNLLIEHEVVNDRIGDFKFAAVW